VAAVVEGEDRTIARARVGLANMGSTPLRASAVERAAVGADAGRLAAAAEHAPEGTSPVTDTNASAGYRRELSKVLVRRALERALERALGVT
jgi:carbon-monoxide dehydrogenase medium subunit